MAAVGMGPPPRGMGMSGSPGGMGGMAFPSHGGPGAPGSSPPMPPPMTPAGGMASPGPGASPPMGNQCGMGTPGGMLQGPGPHGGGCQAMAGGGINLSPQEQEYYHQLYAYADPDRKGYVDRKAGAALLNSTHLPHDTLHAIWDLADSRQEGLLSMERFFVAMRLCAHAQAGRPVSPELGSVEPPVLPDVQDVHLRKGDSDVSPPGSRAPSLLGGHSDISDLQPVISGGEAAVRRAAEHARLGAKSPRSFYRERWAPSAREKRKYATLFHRTDKDGDGFAESSDVRELLDRSGLDLGVLRVAWEHADRELRGKLNWQEFVVIVHLVSCVVRGARMPGQQEGLPPELIAGIQNLEPPEVLIREREARSRSHSPANSRPNSPAFLHASPLPSSAQLPGGSWGSAAAANQEQRTDFGAGEVAGAWTAAEGFQTDGFGAGGDPFPSTAGFGPLTDGFATATDASTAFPSPPPAKEKKSKKSKKEGKHREDSTEWAPADANWDQPARRRGKSQEREHDESLRRNDSFDREHGDSLRRSSSLGRDHDDLVRRSSSFDREHGDSLHRSSSLGREHDDALRSAGGGVAHGAGGYLGAEDYSWSDRREMDAARRQEALFEQDAREMEAREQQRGELTGAVSQFESMINADREVSRQLRREVESMEEELRQARGAHDELERKLKQDQLEAQRMVEQRRQLDRQVQEAKRRLGELREDRRAANLESISLRRDREHFAEELAFLRRMADDEDKTLDVVRRANQFLEKSCVDLEEHTAKLEQQRQELLQQVAAEKQVKQAEERQNAEMQNQRDRIRREQAAFMAERRELQMREMRVQEMQNNNGTADPRRGGASLGPPRVNGSGHSWAHSVSSANGAGAGAGAAGLLPGQGGAAQPGAGPPGVRPQGQPRPVIGREGV